jgi:hypothetical protein
MTKPLDLSRALDGIDVEPDDAFMQRLESTIVQDFLSPRGPTHLVVIDLDMTTTTETPTPITSARTRTRWTWYAAAAAAMTLVIGGVAVSRREGTIKSTPATNPAPTTPATTTATVPTTPVTSIAVVPTAPASPALTTSSVQTNPTTESPAKTPSVPTPTAGLATIVDGSNFPPTAFASTRIAEFAPKAGPGQLDLTVDGKFVIQSDEGAATRSLEIFDPMTNTWTQYQLPSSLATLGVKSWSLGPESVLYGFTYPGDSEIAREIVAVPTTGAKAGTVVGGATTGLLTESSQCALLDDGISCGRYPDLEERLVWVDTDGAPLGKTYQSRSNLSESFSVGTILPKTPVADDDITVEQFNGQKITYRNLSNTFGASENDQLTIEVLNGFFAGGECAIATISSATSPLYQSMILTCHDRTTGKATTKAGSAGFGYPVYTNEAIYTLRPPSKGGLYWSIDRLDF